MSLLSDPAAAAQVGSCLKEVFSGVAEVESARQSCLTTHEQMNVLHTKIVAEEKITPQNKNKLKQLYEEALANGDKVRHFGHFETIAKLQIYRFSFLMATQI